MDPPPLTGASIAPEYPGTLTSVLVSAGADEGTAPEVIRTIGQAIKKTSRQADLVSHMGGGRYVVLLLGTNLQGARLAADRLEAASS